MVPERLRAMWIKCTMTSDDVIVEELATGMWFLSWYREIDLIDIANATR